MNYLLHRRNLHTFQASGSYELTLLLLRPVQAQLSFNSASAYLDSHPNRTFDEGAERIPLKDLNLSLLLVET